MKTHLRISKPAARNPNHRSIGSWPQQISRSTLLTHPISPHSRQQQTPPPVPPAGVPGTAGLSFLAGTASRPTRRKMPAPHPVRPHKRREGPGAPFLPRNARPPGLSFPPLTWALRPRPHVTRFPDPTAAPPTLPGCFPSGSGPPRDPRRAHARGLAPRPHPAPKSGRPSGPAPPHADAARPTDPRRSHNGHRTHRDAGAPVPPASGPRRPGCAPRAFTPRAASWGPWRRRRGRTARGRPSAVPAAAAASSQPRPRRQPQRRKPAPADQRLLSRTARDAHPRPALVAYAARPPPIGPRAVARAGLGLSNSGRGARRGRPGAGRGYYGSFAEQPRTGPSRHRRGVGTWPAGGLGQRRLGEGRRARRPRRGQRAGGSWGGGGRPPLPPTQKITRNAVTAVVFKS